MAPGNYAKTSNGIVQAIPIVIETVTEIADPLMKLFGKLLGNSGPSRSPVSLTNSSSTMWDDDNPALHFTPKKSPAITYRGQMKQK
jgi:hypothetical protein